MENEEGTPRKGLSWRKAVVSAGLVGSGLLAGGILAGTQLAGAANGSSTNSTSAATSSQQVDPATMAHGPDETVLTGDTARKVRAAALEEIPDGTIIRVETDSGGAAYEAHVRKADGTMVTVLFDEDFNVTGTEEGFGPGSSRDSH